MGRKTRNCIDCGKAYSPTKGALDRCSTHYQVHKRRTDLDFFLREKYGGIVKRTNYAKDPRHYGLSVCPKEEFLDFSKQDKNLLLLWNSWKSHNYDLKHCPSIDRIDPSIGYDIDNLQWVTHSHNSGKDKMVPVRAYKDGKLVGEYESKKAAGEALAVHPSNIYNVYMGNRKSAGGFTFEKVNNG